MHHYENRVRFSGQVRANVDLRDAYVDGVVLSVYSPRGTIRLQVDDLQVDGMMLHRSPFPFATPIRDRSFGDSGRRAASKFAGHGPTLDSISRRKSRLSQVFRLHGYHHESSERSLGDRAVAADAIGRHRTAAGHRAHGEHER